MQGFCVIYLDDSLVLSHSKYAGKSLQAFLRLLVLFVLHINFWKSELHLTHYFSLLGLCWETVDMSVSLPSDKHIEIQQLAYV